MAAGLHRPERGDPGGSLQLAGLIGEHRAAFAYDWRTRFGLSLDDLGEAMTWGEAVCLTRVLCQDPSSWVGAALSGWDHPRSFEWFMLADLWDLLVRVNTEKGKRAVTYPRPGTQTERRSAKPTLSQDQVRAALRYAGHDL